MSKTAETTVYVDTFIYIVVPGIKYPGTTVEVWRRYTGYFAIWGPVAPASLMVYCYCVVVQLLTTAGDGDGEFETPLFILVEFLV